MLEGRLCVQVPLSAVGMTGFDASRYYNGTGLAKGELLYRRGRSRSSGGWGGGTFAGKGLPLPLARIR